jgi:TonB-linked SusC/RagA family outer membrane protein
MSIREYHHLKMNFKFKKVDGLNASVSYSRRESHSYNKQSRVPYDLYYFDPAEESQYILSNKLRLENPIVTKQNSNQISESYSYGENYQLNTTLSYSKKFGLHNINSFLTYEQSESEGYSFSAKSETMLIRGIETQKAFDYNKAVADGGMSESGRLGGVGRINYSYADRYLLEAAGRYEGTTKFAPGKRMGFFPSVALGWVMSEEAFMKDRLSFVNFLKLRGSYGVTGYASVGAYEYLLRFGPSGTYLFGGGSAVSGMGVSGKTDVVSSGVSWEKSNMFNGGIDLKVLDSRLGVSIDGFFTRQTDILDSRSVEFPQTSGIISMPSENIGELIAWGYDADISYNGAIGRDFKWYGKGIFNFSANKILARPTDRKPNDFRYPIGQSTFAVGREEGYIDLGIIRSQEQLDAINAEWRAKWGRDYRPFGNVAEVGMLYYQDIGRPGIASAGEPETVFEPDGIISQVNDKTYVQRVNDHFVWQNLLPTSVSMGGSWRDFSFSMLFTMAYGTSNQVVDKLARTVPDKTVSSPAFWSDFWSPENPNGAYPHPKFASFNQLVSTFWMKDVKQLRLKTLNISYNVPKNVSKKIGIPELRLYFVGTNLWSPITTFDYKEDAIARYNTYPLLKTFSLGVNVKL